MPADPTPAPPSRFTLRRIRLTRTGYDSSGAYWGVGDPLFWAATDDGTHDSHFRASDRADAKAIIRRQHPGARFFR